MNLKTKQKGDNNMRKIAAIGFCLLFAATASQAAKKLDVKKVRRTSQMHVEKMKHLGRLAKDVGGVSERMVRTIESKVNDKVNYDINKGIHSTSTQKFLNQTSEQGAKQMNVSARERKQALRHYKTEQTGGIQKGSDLLADVDMMPVYRAQADIAVDMAAHYGKEGGVKAINRATGREVIIYQLPKDVVYEPYGQEARVLKKGTQVTYEANNAYKGQVLLGEGAIEAFEIVEEKPVVAEKAAAPEQALVKYPDGEIYINDLGHGMYRERTVDVELEKQVRAKEQARIEARSKWDKVGRRDYNSQSDLARDVAAFYEGEGGQIVRDPFGREFIRYELPVDGIKYQPVGRAEAEVLTSQTHCVLYNPSRNAGQLMQLESTDLQWFTPVE